MVAMSSCCCRNEALRAYIDRMGNYMDHNSNEERER